MSTGPTKVGTQTTTGTTSYLNQDQLTNLYNAAENQYNAGSTLYQDPTLKPAYNNYLASSYNLANTTAPASYGAWNNAVSGGLGISGSPVYWDLYNLGKGQTPTQLNMTGYSTGLSNLATKAQDTAAGYASNLSDIAAQSPVTGQRYADQTSDYGASAANAGNRYGGYLTGYSTDAIGSGNRYGDFLTDYASAAANAGNRYGSYLTGLGNRALGSTNDYQNTLLDTASGRYLNSNPYLNSMYDTAARGVVRQYQTATAPQADTQYERAGRYGSGVLGNARSQNEQNLGTTLSGLASDIYGTNYARERAAMNTAATAGVQARLAEQDAARQAYRDAATAGLSGYGTGITGLSNASQSSLQGYGTGLTGLSNAARAELAGYGQGASAAADAGKLALSGLEGARLGYTGAANVADTGYRTASDAFRNAGAIDAANLTAQGQGLGAMQSGYEAGNRNTLTALGQTGTVNSALTAPWDTYLKGALGLQDVGQTAANDPWTQLQNLSGILGRGLPTSTTSSQPIYGKSWTDRLLGLGGAVLSPVLGGAGNYLTGSLFGGGGSPGVGGSAYDYADYGGGMGLDPWTQYL